MADETKRRAESFCTSKTFSYVKEILRADRENFYNGFIVKVFDDMIIFFDIVIKREFPILIDDIEVIEPSKKDMDFKTAWDIYEKAGGGK